MVNGVLVVPGLCLRAHWASSSRGGNATNGIASIGMIMRSSIHLGEERWISEIGGSTVSCSIDITVIEAVETNLRLNALVALISGEARSRKLTVITKAMILRMLSHILILRI